MNIIEIIEKKKRKIELTNEEVQYFAQGYMNDEIKDYQVSSFLMAIYFNGLTPKELGYLTQAMIDSGDVIEYDIDKIVVDKHSTGGVGDKTSLVLIPLLASLGFAVSKMSGRGLGHTGGTIDKLEAVANFNVELSEEQLMENVREHGLAIIGQTKELVPLDKKLYALRDVTATVDSIPLIASSIMSKKLALGAEIIVLDVKYGNGALMPSVELAEELAQTMVEIGKQLNKKTIACISSMEQPLGNAVGNSLEVLEAINTLKNEQPNAELKELCTLLATEFLLTSNKADNEEQARAMILEKLQNNEAYDKFVQLIELQGSTAQALSTITVAKNVHTITAQSAGYVSEIVALNIGKAAMEIGAGRKNKDDIIDLEVGILFQAKVGDYVEAGQPLVDIYYNDQQKLANVIEVITDSIKVSTQVVEKPQLIEKILR